MPTAIKQITIGCVPEHYSAPLYKGLESGIFEQHQMLLKIKKCGGGTGEMIKALESKNIDIAVALTEGIVLKSVNDVLSNEPNPIMICGSYTTSPLTWSVAISIDNSKLKSLRCLKKARIGISRYGSGSHIMAIYLSMKNGWLGTDNDFQFVVLNNISGLLTGIQNNDIDAFLWEVVTTKVCNFNISLIMITMKLKCLIL
jgi:sulfonate transport system substrate-binding protein